MFAARNLILAACDVAPFIGVGAGASGSSTSPCTATCSSTASVGDLVLVFASAFSSGTNPITGWTVTYGGTSMGSAFATINNNNVANDGQLAVFSIIVPAGKGGAQTVSVTATAGGGTIHLTANAITYAGLYVVGSAVTNFGSTSTVSVTGTGPFGGVVACALTCYSTISTLSFSGFTGGTQRSNQTAGGSSFPALLIGDSNVPGAQTFSATSSGGSPNNSGISVVLRK